VDHEGKLIADVDWFWAHAAEPYVIAYAYVISPTIIVGVSRFVSRFCIEERL